MPSGAGTRNITHSQGSNNIHVYFRIHFDKHPSALARTKGYLCEVADCGEVLCFSILQGKGKKMTFFPGRKEKKREREKYRLKLSACHRKTS